MRKKHLLVTKKMLNLFLSASIILNSFSPLLVVSPAYAQEAEPTPVVESISEPTPTLEATVIEPTIEPSPSVTPTSLPRAELYGEESPLEPTPTIEITPVFESTSTPELNTAQTITEPTPIILNLDSQESQASATLNPTLTTDKADYAPTDTAIITGSDYQPNTSYTIIVSSQDEPVRSDTASVTTDGSGNLYYTYQLDGIYRPNYLVEIFLGTSLVTSTTFTDAAVPAFSWPSAWDPYLVNGLPIFDDEDVGSHNDPSNGGTNVSPNEIDIASGACAISLNPGPAPSVYNNLTSDTNYQFYRIRLAGDPTASGNSDPVYSQYHWNVLVDTDHNGYADYIVDLFGDTLFLHQGSNSSNIYDSSSPLWQAPATNTTNDYSRVQDAITGSCAQYFIDIAIPVTAFTGASLADLQNAGLFYSTSASNTDPLQKDWMDLIGFITTVSKQVSTDGTNWSESVTVDAGTPVYFQVTLNNTSNVNLTDVSIQDVLPSGFSYISGSTTGVTTSDPTISSQTLTWSGPFTVNYNASISLVFQATTPSVNQQTSFTNTGYFYQNNTELIGQDTADVTADPIVAPTLTLIKTVINNDGGNKTIPDFTLKIDNTTVISGQANTLSPGSYTASEVSLIGYSPSSWTGDCSPDGSVTLLLGDNKTCYITNDDIAPSLIFTKIVSNLYGGTVAVSDFTLQINGVTVTSGEVNTLLANFLYNLSEIQINGYQSLGFGGDCASDGSITLLPGDNASCTITNQDIQPQLTIIKQVINDNGGTAEVSDFPLFVGATAVTSGVTNGFNVGSYTVSETNQSGYTASFSDDCDSNGQVILNIGDSKTCTITNDDQAATLIVRKVIVGSNTPASDFSFSINNTTPSAFEADGQNDLTVSAGIYTVTEPAVNGFDTTYDNCTRLEIPNGGSATCTITNTARGHIIVQKNSIPDGSQEFTFTNNFGNNNPSTFGLTDDSTAGLPSYDAEVLPGSGYSVTEDSLEGWKQQSATCDNDDDPSSITVDAGETVTCTFTNQKLATITLVKETIGGDDTFDFNLTGVTLATNSAQLTTSGNTAQQTFENLDPDNDYSIAEVTQAGWDLSSAICSNGDPINDISPNSGEEITCTFTNTKRGSITVVKETLDETEETFNFTLSGDATASATLGKGESETFDNLLPGSYSLSEDVKTGWELNDVDCESDFERLELDYQQLDLEAGENITCTFTNEGLPSLAITKDNDRKGETLGVNEIVTYTITVKNDGQAPLYNVYVEDSQPIQEYFDYLENSGIVTAPDSSTTNVTATGANPYAWYIAAVINPGEIYTLNYQIKILNTNILGNHYNLAFAYGQTRGEGIIYSDIVEDPFTIGSANDPSTSIDLAQGQVLGAATGTPSIFAILGLLLLALGFLLKLPQKFLKVLPMIVLTFTIFTGSTLASEPVRVQIVDLPGYKNTDNFEISYTTSSIKGIKNVRLEYKRDGIDWTTLTILNSAAGKYQLNSSQINQDGNYSFRATATDNSDNVATDQTNTNVDRHHPPTPESFSKEAKDSNTYLLRWYNPDSDQEYRVITYRSDKPNFTADNNTQIAVINVSRVTSTEWFNDTPGDKTYYYAIRTIDAAGNVSGLAIDQDIQSTSTSTSTQGLPVTGNETFEGTKLVAGTGTGGQVLGEGNEEVDNSESTPSSEEITQLLEDSQDEDEAEEDKSSLPWPLILVGAALAFTIYFTFFKKK